MPVLAEWPKHAKSHAHNLRMVSPSSIYEMLSSDRTDLSVGEGGCRRCWCSDSEPWLLVWAPGSEAQTGSGWGWLDESDSGPGRAGCGETASSFSPSGSRWCWCACLRTRQTDEEWRPVTLKYIKYIKERKENQTLELNRENIYLYIFIYLYHVCITQQAYTDE